MTENNKMSLETISIVVIEYFSIDEIEKCIASIGLACKDIVYELIVSSNSCYPSDKQEELKRSYPGVRWIFNEKNGGFAYGMNQGLKVAKGQYFVIMNPDVVIKKGFADLLQFMDEHPMVGASGPRIVNEHDEVQDSCRCYVSLPHFFSRAIRRIFSGKSAVLTSNFDYAKVQTVDWLIGAFLVVRREAFDQTGGLDDSYFLYAEDVDWCTRIRMSGFEIVYYPNMEIEYEGTRSARRSTKYAVIFLKSHFHYWKKFGFFGGYPKRKKIEF